MAFQDQVSTMNFQEKNLIYTNFLFILVCRWGNTPADDALQSGHAEIVEYIDDYEEKLKLGLRPNPEGGMLGPTSPVC